MIAAVRWLIGLLCLVAGWFLIVTSGSIVIDLVGMAVILAGLVPLIGAVIKASRRF